MALEYGTDRTWGVAHLELGCEGIREASLCSLLINSRSEEEISESSMRRRVYRGSRYIGGHLEEGSTGEDRNGYFGRMHTATDRQLMTRLGEGRSGTSRIPFSWKRMQR